MTERIDPKLLDVPETMLWTLHNRADEAARADSILDDPKCLEIYRALDYDYEQSFGKADGSHGVRSWLFDKKIREFLQQHPDGVIVNLGEGLETQRFRVPTTDTLWLSVDLPEAIAIREHFITPDTYHQHLGISALDTAWFDAVPVDKPVFITAQGLFMYFTEAQMQSFIAALGQRFPQAWLMFDYLPVWWSAKTLSEKGWMKTDNYRTPPMPWGINRPDISRVFSDWLGSPVTAHNVIFEYPRGWRRWFVLLFEKLPFVMNKMPGVTFMQLPDVAEKETYWSRFADDFQQRNEYVVGREDLQTISQAVAQQTELGETLELGCGDGYYTQILAESSTNLTATDWSIEMVAACKKQFAEQTSVTVEQADAKQLPYADNRFDTVFAANLLHVIEKPAAVVAEVHRVLKPGGRFMVLDFCITDMNADDIEAMFKRFVETYGNPPPHGSNLGVIEIKTLLRATFDIEVESLLGERMKAAWVIGKKI